MHCEPAAVVLLLFVFATEHPAPCALEPHGEEHGAGRLDHAAEAAILDAAEADETLVVTFDAVLGVIEGGDLRRRLDHQRTGEHRPAGDVVLGPPVVAADGLDAHGNPSLLVHVSEVVEHRERPPLGEILERKFHTTWSLRGGIDLDY